MPQPLLPDRPVDAAVLFASVASSKVFLDRMTGKRQLRAAGFDSMEGQVAGLRVVAATLLDGTGDYAKVIQALRAAHAPPVLIGAGFSQRVRDSVPVGGSLHAARVVGPEGVSLRLIGPAGSSEGIRTGVIASDAGDASALVANDWSFPFAKACEAQAQPAAVVTVVSDQETAADPSEEKPRHLARRAGKLARKLWKNPRSVLEAAKQTSQRWEHQATLAETIESVLQRVP